MKEMILFIGDNKINIIYKDRLIIQECDSIMKGYIIDKEKFMSELLGIIKKEKIKGKLLGDKINIIKESFYGVGDIAFLESIFNDLGFMKISFSDIKDIFQRDATYIEINKDYMVINLDRGLYLDLKYYKDIPRIIEYFKDFLKKDIILFGSNKCIPDVRVRGFNVYFMDNRTSFVMDCLLKVKK